MEFLTENQVVKSIAVLVCSYVLYIIVKIIIDKGIKKTNLVNKKKGKKATYTKLFTNIVKYIFLVVTVLIILQVNGIDVTSMAAGLGVVGVVVGFALQDALKDIIMGVNIITDNYFVVGDVVKYNDIEGKVIGVGLKTTKIQDINNNNIVAITNRNIDKIINVSNWLDLDIPFSYDEKVEDIEKIFIKLESQIKEVEKVINCEYKGVNEFKESSIIYKLRLYCLPEHKPNIRRAALKIIKVNLDENNIKIPYNQLDVHSV